MPLFSLPSPLRSAIRRLLLLLGLVLVAMGGTGCGRDPLENALQSDARGYWCEACTHRFATEAEVFADRCPQCQSLQLIEVVGYVCPTDQHVTVGPRGKFAVPCEQCGDRTAGLHLPTAADLKTWIARAPTPTPAAEPPSP